MNKTMLVINDFYLSIREVINSIHLGIYSANSPIIQTAEALACSSEAYSIISNTSFNPLSSFYIF